MAAGFPLKKIGKKRGRKRCSTHEVRQLTASAELHAATIADKFEQLITKMKIKRRNSVNWAIQIARSPMPIRAQMVIKTVKTEPMLVHTTS